MGGPTVKGRGAGALQVWRPGESPADAHGGPPELLRRLSGNLKALLWVGTNQDPGRDQTPQPRLAAPSAGSGAIPEWGNGRIGAGDNPSRCCSKVARAKGNG